jgi:hypothetical protein
MKTQVQEAGIRKWFGSDLISLQDEITRAIQFGVLGSKGSNLILSGCIRSGAGPYTYSAGICLINDQLCDFAGYAGAAATIYLQLSENNTTRPYLNGTVGDVSLDFSAYVSTVAPPVGTPHVRIDSDPSFSFGLLKNRVYLPYVDINGVLKDIPKSDSTSTNDTNILATTAMVSAQRISNQAQFDVINNIVIPTLATKAFVGTFLEYTTSFNALIPIV